MSIWVYAAEFRSLVLATDEQGFEWIAMFRVAAETADLAQAWGDRLARRRAMTHGEDLFLRSEVTSATSGRYGAASLQALPLVDDGSEVEDAFIGW